MVMKCSFFQYQKKFINSKFEIKINLLKSRVKRNQSNFTFFDKMVGSIRYIKRLK
jgi:hypothetical protein